MSNNSRFHLLFIYLIILSPAVRAQQPGDSVMTKLLALQNDFTGKIKAMGFSPRLKAPEIVMDNPRSFGNYDDSANILHTGDWKTFPSEGRDLFKAFAEKTGTKITAEEFFELAVHQWIFIHELSHWWRTCQHQSNDPYEEEKGANRIASAYWRERDPAFYKLMLSVFQDIVDNNPSPVPAGQAKEKYLDENYQKLPGGPAYSWYQSIMIVEVSKESPAVTFKLAIERAGRSLPQ